MQSSGMKKFSRCSYYKNLRDAAKDTTQVQRFKHASSILIYKTMEKQRSAQV